MDFLEEDDSSREIRLKKIEHKYLNPEWSISTDHPTPLSFPKYKEDWFGLFPENSPIAGLDPGVVRGTHDEELDLDDTHEEFERLPQHPIPGGTPKHLWKEAKAKHFGAKNRDSFNIDNKVVGSDKPKMWTDFLDSVTSTKKAPQQKSEDDDEKDVEEEETRRSRRRHRGKYSDKELFPHEVDKADKEMLDKEEKKFAYSKPRGLEEDTSLFEDEENEENIEEEAKAEGKDTDSANLEKPDEEVDDDVEEPEKKKKKKKKEEDIMDEDALYFQKMGLKTDYPIKDILRIGRHTQITAAGRIHSFSALILLGTGNATAGLGYGRGLTVVEAVKLARLNGENNMISLELFRGNNIGADIFRRYKKSWCWMKAKSPGSGWNASWEMKKILKAFGITDIVIGVGGSRNMHARYKSIFLGLRDGVRNPNEVAMRIGKKLLDRNRVYYYKSE